ncbi:MAG: hypothetical protein O7G85_12920 [Planctomycetota bacterium]|nr:hypothetical protein [Planctomycetota bacterium]
MLPPDAGSSQTNWKMIFTAKDGDDQASALALEQLARRYWPSVYAFVRSSGRDVHEAADLTQGFVCDVMLGRNLFHEADPKRGRFRTLLLRSLQNYLRERYRFANRKKRSPESGKLTSLDDSHMHMTAIAPGVTPEEAFNFEWGATLVRGVLELVRRNCVADGFESHWVVFESRVVRPMLFGEKPASYQTLVERLDLDDRSQAANMLITVKRRFARTLMAETGRTLSDPARAKYEIMEILEDLERSS